jgi:hypothetical protein
VTLALALSACGFHAPAPRRTPAPPAPPLPLSSLAATLTIPASTIVRELDEKTETGIANIRDQPVDCRIAKCRLDLVATRSGPISGHAANGMLSLDVPLAATAQLSLNAGFFKTKAQAQGTGHVDAQTAIALDSDWHLQTQTHGTVKLSDARLRLGPLKLSLAEIWNRNAERLSEPLFRTLDRRIASGVKIRPQAERLWKKAQLPIRIGKSPEAWLVLAPERIRIAGPVTQNDALSVSLAVDIRARVIIGDRPAPADTALPPPEPLASPSNRFSFAVPVLLPYDDAARLALQRLARDPPRIGGAHVRFETLTILPSGEDVVVAARFCVAQGWDPFGWFDSCGEGYLRGVPLFDEKIRSVRIVHVHYDIATEGAILAAMRALAGDQLGAALERKLVFSVARDMQKLAGELQMALAKPKGRGVVVSGTLQSLGTPRLTWTERGFLVTFPAEGTIHADLNPAGF